MTQTARFTPTFSDILALMRLTVIWWKWALFKPSAETQNVRAPFKNGCREKMTGQGESLNKGYMHRLHLKRVRHLFPITCRQWSLRSPRPTLYQIHTIHHGNQGEAAHFLCFWKIFWKTGSVPTPTTLCSTVTNLCLTSCQDRMTPKNQHH